MWYSSILLYGSNLLFFERAVIILLYKYTTNVFIHSSVDGHLSCFQCRLVWIVLLWIFLYMYFGWYMHSFLLGMYSGVGLLGHTGDTVKMFSKVVVSIYTPTVASGGGGPPALGKFILNSMTVTKEKGKFQVLKGVHSMFTFTAVGLSLSWLSL